MITYVIRQTLSEGLWLETEITVIIPYRKQVKRYRKILYTLKLYKVNVFTVDLMQGREIKYTIFDIILSFHRIGDWGFV